MIDQMTLTPQMLEHAAVACHMYADEFSGGDAYPEDVSGALDFSAAEGLLLTSAGCKLVASASGETANKLSDDEMRLAAIACDMYAEEFCHQGDKEIDPEAWGDEEAESLLQAAGWMCAQLGLVYGNGERPMREWIRYEIDPDSGRWAL
jgi:hypothetical protein